MTGSCSRCHCLSYECAAAVPGETPCSFHGIGSGPWRPKTSRCPAGLLLVEAHLPDLGFESVQNWRERKAEWRWGCAEMCYPSPASASLQPISVSSCPCFSPPPFRLSNSFLSPASSIHLWLSLFDAFSSSLRFFFFPFVPLLPDFSSPLGFLRQGLHM